MIVDVTSKCCPAVSGFGCFNADSNQTRDEITLATTTKVIKHHAAVEFTADGDSFMI